MKRLFNFLRGMATVVASGPFPERFLNLCAQERIDFWAVAWLDGHTLRLTLRAQTLARAEELARRAGCAFRVEGRQGLAVQLARFRRRYGFLAGLSLSLCAVAVLSQFVLTIQVTGNERVSTAVIRNQLRQLGVRPGVYGPGLDRKQLAQQALLGLEDLAWMGLNLHGTRLEVIVRETIEPPEGIDETGYFDVVAEADGVVTHVEAELGDAAVREGDTVAAGDVLISGLVTMAPPPYSDAPTLYYETHARGRIWARTWRTLESVTPLTVQEKVSTGAERTTWYLELLGRPFKIFGKSSISPVLCDKMVTRMDGDPFPAALLRETRRAYTLRPAEVDLSAAQKLLEEQLRLRLEQHIGSDGQVETTRYTARVENGLLRVTLLAQCREEIGREVPGTPRPETVGAENP